MKTVKTRQYQHVKIPNGATSVKVTGFGTTNSLSGMNVHSLRVATNCEWKDITFHNTRTVAMHPDQYNHLLIKNCTFNDQVIEGGCDVIYENCIKS